MHAATAVEVELAARIARHGSLRFDEFVELALYHREGGFFSGGGGAGRAGADFLTSPEVGPLFGEVVARYLDARWDQLGRPDPFVVVEGAAGRGALAISVLAARPRCSAALRWVLVERSAALRGRQREHLDVVHPFEVLGPEPDPDAVVDARHGGGAGGAPDAVPGKGAGPLVGALEDLPAQRVEGVVIANELLDNLPFRVLERTPEGWAELRVTSAEPFPDPAAPDAMSPLRLVELLVPADGVVSALADALAPDAAPGERIPVQEAAVQWLAAALDVVGRGSVLVVDYGDTTAALAARPFVEWVRTYRSHERGGPPLDEPGSQDVTCEVAFDQLERAGAPDSTSDQAAWLRQWGIDELVEQGRRIWAERAAAPDLAAMRARSRIAEAEALTDPAGLGAFRVLEWRR